MTGPSPRWALIVLLGLASGLSAFGMASVVPALPTLERSFNADYASLQFVVSAYLLGLGLFQPIQGLLADRFGRRPVILAGFSVFAAASLLASIANSLLLLVLARFLQAMGVSVATVVSRAVVRDSFEPGPAAIALSFITAVMGVAPVIAPIIGGLAAVTLGWQGVFWVHAVAAVLLLALLAGTLRETRPIDTQAMSLQQLVQGGALLLRDAGFMGAASTYGFVSASGIIFITVGASLYERLFGMGGASFGLLWSGLAVSYVAGATSAGHLARRLGAPRSLRVGFASNVISVSLLAIGALLPEPSVTLFSTALALLMFASGLISPLALSQAVDDHPTLAGVAAGLSSALAMLFSMGGAILTGIFFDGTALPCALLMLATTAGTGWAMRVAERRHW